MQKGINSKSNTKKRTRRLQSIHHLSRIDTINKNMPGGYMYRTKTNLKVQKNQKKKRTIKWQKWECSHYIHSSQVRHHTEGLPRAGLCAGFRTRPAKKLARAWFCDFSPPDVARFPPRLTSLSCGKSRLLAKSRLHTSINKYTYLDAL